MEALGKMTGIVHIRFSNVCFACPNCSMAYSDDEDKYLNRINSGKSGITTITCSRCREKFGMAYNMEGNAVSFNLGKQWRQ